MSLNEDNARHQVRIRWLSGVCCLGTTQENLEEGSHPGHPWNLQKHLEWSPIGIGGVQTEEKSNKFKPREERHSASNWYRNFSYVSIFQYSIN